MNIALKGVPAVRAALHGARLGAGASFGPAVIESLGLRVLPQSARAVADSLGRHAGEAAVVLKRGGAVVRAGVHEFVLHGGEGVTLRVSPRGGAMASVSRETVRAMGRTTVRGAVAGIGRAAFGGAAAGAVVDGGMASYAAVRAFRRGEINQRQAMRSVGLHAARGAVSGAAGVAAAGIVAAGLAATGVTILAAPVAIPIATMIAVGAAVSQLFDRRFGTV